MREFFVNADFDLSLRRRRSPGRSDARSRQAAEIPLHLLMIAVAGDSVLVPRTVDDGFFEYLSANGLPEPSIRLMPGISGQARFTPFGWNAEAAELNERYLHPTDHPDLEVVRRVNGRLFSAEMEHRFGKEAHVLGVVRSVEELQGLLDARADHEGAWLVKSEHGNGGFGNRRIRSRKLERADRGAVGAFLEEDERVIVEVWRPRIVDLASVFEVETTGEVRDLRIYEVVNTADGALIGDFFDPSSPHVERWGPELQGAMRTVARDLAAAGYFGPACVDSFVWDDHGEQRLRPVVDINARLSVSVAAERLWRLLGCDRVVYWRLFSARKLELPDSISSVSPALGDEAFDPELREGVLLTSPMVVDGRPLRRLGVALVGRDRRAVDSLDRRFRENFER